MEAKQIFKQLLAKIEKSEDGMLVTISTASVDRDGDILESLGVKLDNYLKNPVVLWGHDHSIPAIGKSLWVKTTKNTVKAKLQWASTPFAEEIRSLYEEDILNAFSVGFMPETWEDIDKGRGRRYTEWELLEFSAVNVPANAEALVSRSKSMSAEVKAAVAVDAVKLEILEARVAEQSDTLETLAGKQAELAKTVETLGQKDLDDSAALDKLEQATKRIAQVEDALAVKSKLRGLAKKGQSNA